MAASRTVPDTLAVHSLHAYFLLPGDVAAPLIYIVERTRDGKSFATRHVTAQQHGQPVFQMTASFQRQERGFEHAAPMPGAQPLSSCSLASSPACHSFSVLARVASPRSSD